MTSMVISEMTMKLPPGFLGMPLLEEPRHTVGNVIPLDHHAGTLVDCLSLPRLWPSDVPGMRVKLAYIPQTSLPAS